MKHFCAVYSLLEILYFNTIHWNDIYKGKIRRNFCFLLRLFEWFYCSGASVAGWNFYLFIVEKWYLIEKCYKMKIFNKIDVNFSWKIRSLLTQCKVNEIRVHRISFYEVLQFSIDKFKLKNFLLKKEKIQIILNTRNHHKLVPPCNSSQQQHNPQNDWCQYTYSA